MVKTITLAVVVLLAATISILLIYAATKPNDFRVRRVATIKAPPERIFALVNDLPRHREWSPWEQKDPGMKRTYSGPTSGKGAVYEWDGNKDIGQGRMEIVESTPTRIVYAMHFIKPFEAHNTAEITLEPKGDTTTVTWAIYGPMPYLSKVFTIFFSMDTMIGKEFETGLAKLKALTET